MVKIDKELKNNENYFDTLFGTAIAELSVTLNDPENIMATATILDWTDATVLLKQGNQRDIRYQVYKDGGTLFLEIRDIAGEPVHTLELPDGMKLEKSSYEVLLRYVLLDVVAA